MATTRRGENEKLQYDDWALVCVEWEWGLPACSGCREALRIVSASRDGPREAGDRYVPTNEGRSLDVFR